MLNKATAGRLRKCGLKPGMPDILAFHASRVIGLELKARDNDLSHDQRHMRSVFDGAQIPYYTIRSIERLIEVLQEHQFPLRKGIIDGYHTTEARSAAQLA